MLCGMLARIFRRMLRRVSRRGFRRGSRRVFRRGFRRVSRRERGFKQGFRVRVVHKRFSAIGRRRPRNIQERYTKPLCT